MVRPIFPIFISSSQNSKTINVNALLDTGSNKSCIVKEFADRLGLLPINQGIIIQASAVMNSIYSLNFIFSENLVYTNVQVMAIPKQPTVWGNYDVLIGMDIIRTGNLTINSASGNTLIAFEVKESENKNGVQ